MRLTPAIYRNSPHYFIAFAVIVFAGFWVYYVDPVGRRGSQALATVPALRTSGASFVSSDALMIDGDRYALITYW